jgi:serine/threonine-protein kinase
LGRLLGDGGFGHVFEAWDPALCRQVAIKQLKPDTAQAQGESLLDEARLAASLRHPAFVQIYALEDDGRGQSIVMELVHGQTLRQIVATQVLPVAQALDILAQVADAMAVAHGAGLVHGDLKPANLMVESSGLVRILDFGLARRIDLQATGPGDGAPLPGTIAYMAPETLLGQPADARSDIYSVGVVLYEMLCGARPFAHLNGLALAAAQVQSSSAQWRFADSCDPDCAALVRALAARDPAQRPASMQEVAERARVLQSASAASAAIDAPAVPPTLAQPYRLYWRKLAWTALGVVLLAGGVLGRDVLLPPGTQLVQRWLPASDAQTMADGMAALSLFDRDGALDIAAEKFSAILARKPDHAAAAAGLALTYALRYMGDRSDDSWLQRADASAQLALAHDDQLALAYAAQAMVRTFQGDNAAALRLEEHALKLDPLNLFALSGRIGILIRMQRFDDAQRYIDSALAVYPRERRLIDQGGTLRYRQGDYRGAEQQFRRSIEVEPDAVTAYANLNAALLRQGRMDEALQVLQQGLQIRPSGQLYTNLGTALFQRGDYLGSAEAFEHAVSVSKGSNNAYLRWANLADTLRWIPGRESASRDAYHEAAELLRKLLARSPNDVTYLSRLALYCAKLGLQTEAAALIQRALANAPKDPDVRFRAAMAYELTGQRDAALRELGAAQQMGYPDSFINAEPDLLALRRDPRFQRVKRKGNP